MTDKQTEDKIFTAATDVFEERGMDGARMQDIADRAGINKALLHYYFRTKDLLFEAVFQKLAGKMLSRFSPILEDGRSLEDKIRFFFREHIGFLQENPRLPAFLINEINRNPQRIRKIVKKLDLEKIWETLERQHSKEFEEYKITRESLPQIMTTIAAISVFPFAAKGLLEGLFDHMNIDFKSYSEERKEFAAEFVINALKARKNERKQGKS
jgi:AcrR family transcriptional regulator